ncbi:MAG: threonine synthase, partial [Crocinitomicaceae bacterium]|nr:threonine synthase [Crocinitomicaceae bacterium]
MKYISSRKNEERVSFQEAVLNGLSKNGGLYLPEVIPVLPTDFFQNIQELTNSEVAFQVLSHYVGDSLSDRELRLIIQDTLSFEIPIIPVEKDVFVLELFHGPTQAFKDLGARFMSRCLKCFYADKKEELTVLVATSGDTGGAVANGFYGVEGVTVKILFPKGKVSSFQEHQMTSLGGNVQAIEVDGTFDDCQKLVKEAFLDTQLRQTNVLSSANSINVARLLPQMLFYFFLYKQLKSRFGNREVLVSVPSGNLGNVTAGLIAKKMGLPIKHFIAGLNMNDTFLNYL